MAHAHGHLTADAFSSVLGTRRGAGVPSLTAARAALDERRFEQALRCVDDGLALRDPKLVDRLAVLLAHDMRDIAGRLVELPLRSTGIMRDSLAGGELALWDDEYFTSDAFPGVHDTLMRGLGKRRGRGILLSDCESSILRTSRQLAADYLKRGGAAHLQRYFGRAAYSGIRQWVSDGTDVTRKSPALASLLRDAITPEWVQALCENPSSSPEDKTRHATALAAIAVDQRHRDIGR